MPLYDYECESCKHRFEARYSIKEMKVPEGQPCPECGEFKVKKIFAGAPSIGDAVRLGIRRPDDGFKEVLQKIDENNRGSRIRTDSRYA